MERISKHISYKEGVHSNTATRLNIDNTPSSYEFSNMGVLADNIFEPLREWVGGPIKITSFFRCEELNRALGGSSSSQHCEGRAMDIDDIFGRTTNALMFEYIKNNLDFYHFPYTLLDTLLCFHLESRNLHVSSLGFYHRQTPK